MTQGRAERPLPAPRRSRRRCRGRPAQRRCGLSRSSPTTAPDDLDADLGDERLRHRAARDDRRRVPRARTFERIARIGKLVLHDARKIGVARARKSHGLLALPGRVAFGRPWAHPPLPVRVIAIADEERERRPEGAAVPEAGEDLDRVRLDLLPRAAPVALLAAVEVRLDRSRGRARDPQAGP